MRSRPYNIELWQLNHLLLFHKDKLSNEQILDITSRRDRLQDQEDEYWLDEANAVTEEEEDGI